MDRMDYFIELYGNLPRAGPGDDASTRRAFEMLQPLAPRPRILDLGCGPGAQTLELLRRSDGTVIAFDLLETMIARVRAAVTAAGFAARVEAVQGDMHRLEFPTASFDVVWSEGAIYNLGFENGLKRVRELVRPGGFVAVTEPVWLVHDPPEEAVEFWREYPEIADVATKLETVSRCGYEPLGEFVLPDASWTEAYYDPLMRRVEELTPEWETIPDARSVLEEARAETSVFARHSASYSYAFFVMRR
ncbi:MAG: methyltransferase domain-containing protein [bacterium]|nr:methyltransferase domain-containing protein [bacterium]